MKVIKDNYNVLPKEVICPNCASIILLEDANDVCETSIGENAYQWECPCCEYSSITKIIFPF